jgi:hypothetical protein
MPGTNPDLTSNARNKVMIKTATDFSQQVKKCEKAIRTASAANAELLTTTKATMTMPLPQTYDESNGGLGSAAAALNLVGGPSFKADAVSRVGNDSGHKLETEVLAPLTRWQEVHLQLAARFKELENTRLELDSRRRTVSELASKVSAMRSRLGTGAGGAKPEAKLDATIRMLSHKEAKLKVTTQNFDQQEALLARDLAALIADGQYLKHYVAAALRLQGGALLGAAEAFGELSGSPAPAPAPGTAQASPVGTPTGTLAGGVGAAGFGAVPGSASAGPPTRSTSDASNPYHSTGTLGSGGPVTGSLAVDRPAGFNNSTGSQGAAGGPPSMGSTKRFSEPEPAAAAPLPEKGGKGADAAAHYPASEQQQTPSDNPYAVRGYSYA